MDLFFGSDYLVNLLNSVLTVRWSLVWLSFMSSICQVWLVPQGLIRSRIQSGLIRTNWEQLGQSEPKIVFWTHLKLWYLVDYIESSLAEADLIRWLQSNKWLAVKSLSACSVFTAEISNIIMSVWCGLVSGPFSYFSLDNDNMVIN